jgi:hypothetical protein
MSHSTPLEALLSARSGDGGWPYLPSRASRVEPTALAALALDLRSTEAAAARRWLAARQEPDGSFLAAEGAEGSGWTTPLAMLALGADPDAAYAGALSRATECLLRARPGILRKPGPVRLSGRLEGWAWTSDTFSWVEPTAYALLALKHRPVGDAGARQKRIREGEALLWDRMCDGGGWNFGNPAAFGYAIRPFPVPTALALLALRNHAADPRTAKSLETLRTIAASEPSALGLGWAVIALRACGRSGADLEARLAKDLASPQTPARDVPSLAVAALALGDPARLESIVP